MPIVGYFDVKPHFSRHVFWSLQWDDFTKTTLVLFSYETLDDVQYEMVPDLQKHLCEKVDTVDVIMMELG